MSPQQQLNKKKKNFSKTLKTQIKRKPHTQQINGIQITYGLLQKKSQSSLFNNQRLLIIKGTQTFGYASKLSDNIDLPFYKLENIPKPKIQIPLQQIDINNQKQFLIIQFLQKDHKQKTKWQFKCVSKPRAIEWRQRLQSAKNQKLIHLKNPPIKVILQDPNQNQSDSQIHTHHNKTKQKQLNTKQIVKQLKQEKQKINKSQSILIIQNNDNLIGEQENRQQNNMFEQLLVNGKNNKKQLKINNKEYNKEYERTNNKEYNKINNKEYNKVNNKNQQDNYSSINIRSVSLITQQQKKSNSKDKSTSSNVNAKQLYKLKKIQQNKYYQQLQQGSNPIISPVLNAIVDPRFHLENMKREWAYEFVKGINQQQIVQNFRLYFETVTAKIVSQLSLQSRKRYYKPISETSYSMKYQIHGVSLQLFYSQLSEVASFHQKGTIVRNQMIKLVYQQHKNYNYLLQISNNKGKIRVPLTMCIQYKGFYVFIKALMPEGENYDNIEPLQKELQLLQGQSRIHNSVFQDPQNGRIIPVQNKVYQKLSRLQNNPKKFDICYIQGLKFYLPQDFYKFNKTNQARFLRKQLIQDQQYEQIAFYGQNMTKVVNRLKIPPNLKQGVDVLTQVSKSIPQRANRLIASLLNLDQVITNSKDLSNLMHGYGLNMRYLGLVLQKCNQTWLKQVVMSEIVARSAKYFMKFDLQNLILNLNQPKIQNIRRYQIKLVIQFLNKLFGNSQQTQIFWNQLNKQSQTYFQCHLDRSLLNICFLIQAIQYHCRIRLIRVNNQRQFFRCPNPLNIDNFGGFEIKSKTYDLNFTQLYSTVINHIKQLSLESYQQLSILLNLQRKQILPSHFALNSFDQRIILFMINWLPPKKGNSLYFKEDISSGLNQILPNKALYQIRLAQIKWLLKQRQQQSSQLIKDWIIQHVNRWLGQYHPILSQLYDLYSRYYLQDKNQQKKCITYCKSSIKNQQKLLGTNHIKLADNYYMLSQIYINWQRKTQAINSLRRAKEILEQTDSDQSQAYGVILLKIAGLLLSSNSTKQALQYALQAYSKLISSQSYSNIVQVIQLIGRCYEISGEQIEYVRFSEQVSSKLSLLFQNPILLQRAIKIIIFPYFKQLSKNSTVSKSISNILLGLPVAFNSNLAYQYLKQKIQSSERSFPSEFIAQLDDLQDILQQVQNNGIMARWKGLQNIIVNKTLLNKVGTNIKGFNFIATIEALNIFLGPEFIQGILSEY